MTREKSSFLFVSRKSNDLIAGNELLSIIAAVTREFFSGIITETLVKLIIHLISPDKLKSF